MPPRRTTRGRALSSSSSDEEGSVSRNKRRRGAATASQETPLKRTRFNAESSSPNETPARRSARTTLGSTALRTSNTSDVEARKPQMARRTGGRPRGRPRNAPAEAVPTEESEASQSQSSQREGRQTRSSVAVEIPRRASGRQSRPSASSYRDVDDSEYEEDDDEEVKDEQLTPRAARQQARATARRPTESAKIEIVEISDDESDDGPQEAVGAAGPGPSTAQNRLKKSLHPVPQPSPSVFHKYLDRPPLTSQAESIDNPDSSPPETQPRTGRMMVVDGVEMMIFDDDEDDDEEGEEDAGDDDELPKPEDAAAQADAPPADEEYRCGWKSCTSSFPTYDELADHIENHADMFRRGTSRRQPADQPRASTRSMSPGTADRLRAIEEYMQREVAQTKAAEAKALADAAAARAELAAAKQAGRVGAAALEDSEADLDEYRHRVRAERHSLVANLAGARADYDKQAAMFKAEADGRIKALQDELKQRSAEVATLQDALVESRTELAVREAMVEELRAERRQDESTLARRDATIRELREQLAAASDGTSRAAPEPGSLSSLPETPLDDKLRERDETIASLEKRLKEAKKSVKVAKSDLAFIREQYEVASNSAVEEVKRREALEAEAAKLREQLELGLKQRDLFSAAAMDAVRREAAEARHRLNLLLEQNRRTDDAIRRKAAQHHDLSRERRELEVDLHNERARAHELSKRNDELNDQVTELRGRLVGAFDKIEESDSDDDEDDVEPPRDLPMPALVPDYKPSAALVSDATLAADLPVWQCKWIIGDAPCGLCFDSRDELDAHGMASHINVIEAAQS